MTHAQFMAWLKVAEREFPVTGWKCRGIQVWPLIRLSLYASNFHAATPAFALGAGVRRYAEVVTQATIAWARATLLDWRSNQSRVTSADAVFLAYSIGVQPLIEGRRYNPLLAPFVELLEARGRRSTVWEMSPFGEYNLPRSVPSAFIQPYLILLRFWCQLAPVGREEVGLERYPEFIEEVRRAELTLPHGDLSRLRRDALFIRRLADRFKRWLCRARPVLGFVADAGPREQAFCLACRELGILSVEIQHGIQGENHPTYGGWSAIPPGGYKTRPEMFWVWDERSRAAIVGSGVEEGGGQAVVGGDPWREIWWGDGGLVRRTLDTIAERKRVEGGTAHILVTLDAWGDLLPRVLADAMRRAPPEWRWWLRLHPVNQEARRAEARRSLPELRVSLQLMEQATAYPLHPLLRRMDCHVTAGRSTVVQEAADAGVPSVACDPEAAVFYAAELERGALRMAGTADEVISAIKASLAAGRLAGYGPRPDPGTAMDDLLATAQKKSSSLISTRPPLSSTVR